MKFEEIYIDGFGIFHDHHIKNLTPGLTILVGPNEAGKSTILSFQKRILFGFPDGRSGLNLYPRLAGGNHGGRLIVSTGDNTKYIIERYSKGANDVKVILPDGSTGGTTELSNLLGHANKDIFENIYAFGLTELQDFKTLNSEAVKGRIYSAGTGIGAISLSEVQKNLETEAGKLFKERGSKPEINVLFNEIKNVGSKLREIEKDIQKFDNLHKELEEITNKITNAEHERNQIRTKFNHTTNLITVWDDWRKMQEAEERLQKIPEIENFPESGIEMLERNIEKIDELNERISEKNAGLGEIKIDKSAIKIDEKLLSNKEKILELQKGQDKYTSAVIDLPTLEEKLKRDKEGLKESLHEIGPDWDAERLSNFDISIPTKEIVRRQHKAIEETRENIRDTENEVQRIEHNIKNIEEEILDKRLKTQSFKEVDKTKLEQQRKSLRLLRIKYPDLKEREADIRNLEEKGEIFTILKPHRMASFSKLPFWPVLMFIAAGIASLILSILGNNWVIGIGILAILSVSAIIYYNTLSRKGCPTTTPVGFKDKEDELSERREKLESELQKVKNEMLSNAQICEFEDIPDPQLIEDKDSELQAASENLLKSNELEKQQEALEQQLRKRNEEVNTAKNEREAIRKEKEKAQKKWKNWLNEKGLGSQLTPEGAIDIFTTIKTCIEKKKSIKETKERIDLIQESIEEYEIKISSVLEDCNGKREELNVIAELKKITEELNQAVEDSKTLEQQDIGEEKLKSELRNLKEKLKERKIAFSELLSQGFAETENEFRDNARNWGGRNKLMDEILQREQNIQRISGDGKLYSDFINELGETSPEDLKENELQLKDGFDMIEHNLSELREKRGGIAKEIEQIERREQGSSLRVEKTVEMQKLKKKSEEWSILTLARTTMGKAIEKYEQERQPEVIKEAQSFFSKMTLGRYSRVLAPLGEAKIYAEDKDGSRKDVQDLSGGTAEQLYLSLRFGFIREFSKRSESLPIVFDDILVNFDPERFRAACEAIKELAKTNQVLYFTCHPENADLLTKIIPDSKIIDINSG